MRIIIGYSVLLLILPRLILQCVIGACREYKFSIFQQELTGRECQTFIYRRLMIRNRPLTDIDKWFHYAQGRLDLIGPKPLELTQVLRMGRAGNTRLQVRPGIIQPYRLKQRSGIAFEDENSISMDFVLEDSYMRRCQLMLTFLVQKITNIRGKEPNRTRKNFDLFGVAMKNVSMRDALSNIERDLSSESLRHKYAFVNADCANKCLTDVTYRETLNAFEGVFLDGVGVRIAAKWHGENVAHNVNGTDMFPLLCRRLSVTGHRIFLLGAKESVIKKLQERLTKTYPDLQIAGASSGYFSEAENESIIRKINSSTTDILLVAMGAPRQEKWILNNIERLDVKVAIGVGGLFDFYSGSVSRAPIWVRELSLEWAWRLAVQPIDKGRRYLINAPLFMVRAAKSALLQNKQSLRANLA